MITLFTLSLLLAQPPELPPDAEKLPPAPKSVEKAEHKPLNQDKTLLLEIGHERANFERAFGSVEFRYLPVSQGEQMLVWLPRITLLQLVKAMA